MKSDQKQTPLVGRAEPLQVCAPSDLPAGYQLEVTTSNQNSAVVTVPDGGVRAGEVFMAVPNPIPTATAVGITTTTTTESDNNYKKCDGDGGVLVPMTAEATRNHGGFSGMVDGSQLNETRATTTVVVNGVYVEMYIPTGQWRDGLCESCCCKYCDQPMSWNVWCCCPAIVLGQVMTRLDLDWKGDRLNHIQTFMITDPNTGKRKLIQESSTTSTNGNNGNERDLLDRYYRSACTPYKVMWILIIVNLLFIFILGSIFPGLATFVYVAFAVYVLFIMAKTRGYVRRKYNIDGNCCCDICCSYWCNCCVATQLFSHTADLSKYRSTCCTETGLDHHAPMIV